MIVILLYFGKSITVYLQIEHCTFLPINIMILIPVVVNGMIYLLIIRKKIIIFLLLVYDNLIIFRGI